MGNSAARAAAWLAVLMIFVGCQSRIPAEDCDRRCAKEVLADWQAECARIEDEQDAQSCRTGLKTAQWACTQWCE